MKTFNLKNLTMRKKFSIGLIPIAFTSTLVVLIGYVGFILMNNADTKMYEQQLQPLEIISEMMLSTNTIKSEITNVILNFDDTDKITKSQKAYNEIEKELSESIEKSNNLINENEFKSLYEEANKLYTDSLKPSIQEFFTSATSGNYEDTQNLASNCTITIDKISENYQQCYDNIISKSTEAKDYYNKLYLIFMIILSTVLVLGTINAIKVIKKLSEAISKPINKILNISTELEKGNVDVNVDIDNQDEIGLLANSLDKMIVSIKEQVNIMSEIANGNLDISIKLRSENDVMGIAILKTIEELNIMFKDFDKAAYKVSNGSAQVSSVSQTLSQGATEQASSIEELSANINEITNKINIINENAENAKEISSTELNAVSMGQKQMNEMVKAMNNISDTSNQIGEIIKSIDDIAFQTNILSINAAVEAASAGVAGKGFTVVADEVRTLAAKSAENAKSTAILIDNILNAINKGTNIVTETEHSLKNIVSSSEKSAAIIQQISDLSSDQKIAISQVNIGVEQISVVVQNTSATAEESAAASEELHSQANILKNQLENFKLK